MCRKRAETLENSGMASLAVTGNRAYTKDIPEGTAWTSRYKSANLFILVL